MANQKVIIKSKPERKYKDNIIHWCTFYRRNPHIYTERRLGIKLKFFQKVALWLLLTKDTVWWIATRGASKSFIAGVAAIDICMLYPHSEVVITSSTVGQASKLMQIKIRDEIIKKLSPYLRYLYDRGVIEIKNDPTTGYPVLENHLNESTIRCVPPEESARGLRATCLIFEEARLIKKQAVDAIFMPMQHPRQAKYIVNETEYAKNKKRWLEEARTIYITSAKFKTDWIWTAFKKSFEGSFNKRGTTYEVYATDIWQAIDENLKTNNDYFKYEREMSRMDFLMEVCNVMLGNNENAYFELESLTSNAVIEEAFIPPVEYEWSTYQGFYKKDTEIRIVSMDLAFANSTRGKNDNTVILCMSMHWLGDKNCFERHIDYIEPWEASDSLGAVERARELFSAYDADYLIFDANAGGQVVFNAFTEARNRPELGGKYISNGFGIAVNPALHTAPSAKLQDYRYRTVDPEAIPVLVPHIANPQTNSQCAVLTKQMLRYGKVKFLISATDYQRKLEEAGTYFTMNAERLGRVMKPFMWTDQMISEVSELRAYVKGQTITVHEVGTNTKDCYSALSYALMLSEKIENEYQQTVINEDTVESIDLFDWVY